MGSDAKAPSQLMIDSDLRDGLKRMKELKPYLSEGHLVREALRNISSAKVSSKCPLARAVNANERANPSTVARPVRGLPPLSQGTCTARTRARAERFPMSSKTAVHKRPSSRVLKK